MEQNKAMQMKMVGRKMGIRMGIVMSVCLAFLGTATSGHFTVIGFVLNVLISALISIGIGVIVPVGKISQDACQKRNLQRGSMKARLLETLISDLIYTPVITLVLVFFSYGMAMMQSGGRAQLSFLPMFLKSLIISLIAGYILIFIFMPLFLKQIMKQMQIGEGEQSE